jgi:hypothetical protein
VSGTHNFYDDLDDEDTFDPSEGDVYDPTAPLFGCACENPLSVDTVCEGCAAYLEEEHAESERERLARASAFTVEECVYWLRIVKQTYRHADPLLASYMSCFDVFAREALMQAALAKREGREDDVRAEVATWALCREAIRAIERESAR